MTPPSFGDPAVRTVRAGILILLAGALYAPTMGYLWGMWQVDDYSHSLLIPFVILYVVWEKREAMAAVPYRPAWQGTACLAAGLALFWIGELGGEFLTLNLSLWLVIQGILIQAIGWEKLKVIRFAPVLMLAMIPLPRFLYNQVSLSLKLVSSRIGTGLMQAGGLSVFRDGNVIDLGVARLQVVDACSGLRYLFPMIVLSLLVAYFYRAAPWKRLVVVVSSVPLTVLFNGVRIAATGVLSLRFGPAAVDGFFHDFEGWLIFMTTLAVLLGEVWCLEKFFAGRSGLDPTGLDPTGPDPTGPDPTGLGRDKDSGKAVTGKTGGAATAARATGLFCPGFTVAVGLLALTLSAAHGVEFRERVPLARALCEFPLTLESWQGTPRPMDPAFLAELDLSDYLMADFRKKRRGSKRNGEGAEPSVDLYVAYYESQRKGESIHSPATCLRGNGWVFRDAGREVLTLEGGRRIPVRRAVIQKGPVRRIAYYWFPSRGRDLTSIYEIKWFNFWDALIRQRTDGALVRLITPWGPDEDMADTDARLQAFARVVIPKLERFLPGKE